MSWLVICVWGSYGLFKVYEVHCRRKRKRGERESSTPMAGMRTLRDWKHIKFENLDGFSHVKGSKNAKVS